jgi:hypothetical protein
MATAILTAGTTAASSATFTLTEGQEITLALFPATGAELPQGRYIFRVKKQASTGQWNDTRAYMDRKNPTTVFRGRGTFRVDRPVIAGAMGVGVDRD